MPRFCANLTMLYGERGFLDRFAAAAADGFEGVEYLFPYDFPKEELRERLERHGLVQVLHNLPAGDWGGGERGIAALPGREGEFRDGVGRAIEYAAALGCEQVNCLAGVPPEGADPERVHRALVENLRFGAAELGRAGIRLLLEPVNTFDIPGFHVNRVGQAASLIEEVGSGNLFIQYDLYHQQRAEGELAANFRRFKDRIAHVQLADNPGRNEPGTGEINYPFLFDMLDREGYAGWIGCEYKPRAGTSEGLGWFQPHRGRA
jgi:hydroxypyruvate isomerase